MRVCTYKIFTPVTIHNRLGILNTESEIIDVNLVWEAYFEDQGYYNAKERAEHKCPSQLSRLLRLKDNPIETLKESLEKYSILAKNGIQHTKSCSNILVNLKDDNIGLSAPLDSITSYRDFFTHEKHVAKGFEKRKESIPKEWYEIPFYYKGTTTGFIGHETEVLWPKYSKILDYELELAMIIGKDGKNINEEDALNHIFGFTILNDISARDIQKKEMAIRLGPAKAKDFCSIIGPVITTIDEFGYKEPNLEMTAYVNGSEWSRGRSGDAHFSWAQMISHASQDEWLRAGDLFGSGTVGTGCGLELDKWIQPGDTIELAIENIGTLRNTIGKPYA